MSLVLILAFIDPAHGQGLVLQDEPLMTLGSGFITGVQYSPDGKYLAVAFTSRIELLDAITFDQVKILEERADELAFNPTGDILAFAAPGAVLKLWYINSDETIIVQTDRSCITGLTFSSKSNIVAMGTCDGATDLWNIGAEGDIKVIRDVVPITPSVLAVHPDGTFLAYSDEPDHENIHLWDVTSRKETKVLKGHTYPVFSSIFWGDKPKERAIPSPPQIPPAPQTIGGCPFLLV